MRLAFADTGEELRSFWSARYYGFNVYGRKKFKEKLLHIHRNPVTRDLVEDPKDWPWSSWSCYAKGEARLVAIDIVPS